MTWLLMLSCGSSEPVAEAPVENPVEPTPAPEPVSVPVPEPAQSRLLPVGAVGVVTQEPDGSFQVVFPRAEMPGFEMHPAELEASKKNPFAFPELAAPPILPEADLVMFDTKGDLGTLTGARFVGMRWCENDGGLQYRPEYWTRELTTTRPPTMLPSSDLRQHSPDPMGGTVPRPGAGVVAFVRVGAASLVGPLTFGEPAADQTVKVLRDWDGDGVPETELVHTLAHAVDSSADGRPDVALTRAPDEATCEDGDLNLATPRGVQALRCCGP